MDLNAGILVTLIVELLVFVFGGGRIYQKIDDVCTWKKKAESALQSHENDITWLKSRCDDSNVCSQHNDISKKLNEHGEKIASLDAKAQQ